MKFTKAQEDMRKSYFGGDPEAFASGIGGFLLNKHFHLIGIVNGIIEILFSFIIIYLEKKNRRLIKEKA